VLAAAIIAFVMVKAYWLFDLSLVLSESIFRALFVAESTSETSGNFYQTTRRKDPKDRQIHASRRENYVSQKSKEIKRRQEKEGPVEYD
jgi:hypothetical protein